MRYNEYRLNVRFDLNDEKQRRIAETLQKLDRKKFQSINAFVVTAVGDYLDRLEGNGDLTLDRIRAISGKNCSRFPSSAYRHQKRTRSILLLQRNSSKQ